MLDFVFILGKREYYSTKGKGAYRDYGPGSIRFCISLSQQKVPQMLHLHSSIRFAIRFYTIWKAHKTLASSNATTTTDDWAVFILGLGTTNTKHGSTTLETGWSSVNPIDT